MFDMVFIMAVQEKVNEIGANPVRVCDVSRLVSAYPGKESIGYDTKASQFPAQPSTVCSNYRKDYSSHAECFPQRILTKRCLGAP